MRTIPLTRHSSFTGAIALVFTGAAFAQNIDLSQLGRLPRIETVTPKDNPGTPEKIELGRMLYFDTRLSGDSSKSCASCHVPETGWTNRAQLSDAYPGTKHWRGVPTVLNAAYQKALFWDGRAASLEEQAQGPIQAPIEMNQNPDHLVEKLSSIPDYRKRFKEVFGGPITFDNIAKAIAAFERTVVSRNVPFDRFLDGDKSALDEQQLKGLRLFVGKANCVACHNGPNLSDGKFHALGVPEIEPLQKESDRIATRHFFAKGAGYKNDKDGYKIPSDYGREIISKKADDRHKFLTPSLREIAHTPPYMHNGAFTTLEEVIDFIDKGGGDIAHKDPLLKPLHLTDEEKQQLVAFLESLSGDEIIIEAPELPRKEDGSF